MNAPASPVVESVSSVLEELLALAQVRKKEKFIEAFEGKKNINAVRSDIKEIKASLIYSDAMAQDFVIDILLGRMTLGAAQRRLRVEKNFNSVLQFQTTLGLNSHTADILFSAYALPSAPLFFDDEMTAALSELIKNKNVSDSERALAAVDILKTKATQLPRTQKAQNLAAIEEISLRHGTPLRMKRALKQTYAGNTFANIKQIFETIFNRLNEVHGAERLNAVLAVRVMLNHITLEDAVQVALLAREIKYPLLEEDLTLIAIRYLRTKKLSEIVETFDALLKRLPFYEVKEENLGLVVEILLDGTKNSLDSATERAQKFKDRSAYRAALNRRECYNGFVFEIAKEFAGKLKADELYLKYEALLNELPFCSNKSENYDLACKLLLSKITPPDAHSQAAYRRDLRAQGLIRGLAPECIKKYLGTQSPEDITKHLETTLKPYSFWKSDEAKHRFSHVAIIDELNGRYGGGVTRFILNSLEEGELAANIEKALTFFGAKDLSSMDFDTVSLRYKETFQKNI